jgi:hypothetical protein
MNISIEFDENKILLLIKSIYFALWVQNAWRDPDEADKEMEGFSQYILTALYKSGEEDNVEYDHELDAYLVKQKTENGFQKTIGKYNDDTFWKELSFRLSERDYFLTQTEDKLGIESIKERDEIQEMYDIEFHKNGINNLQINDHGYTYKTIN